MDAHLATHLGDPPALEGQVPQSFRPGAVDATELKHLCSICEAASIRVGPVSGARLHFARPWARRAVRRRRWRSLDGEVATRVPEACTLGLSLR